MKKQIKRILCVIFSISILTSVISAGVITVNATSSMSLAQLQEKFPNGAYWNHVAKVGHGYNYTTHYGDACGDVENTYTWTPCCTHLEEPYRDAIPGEVDCNSFAGGIQCWAFARKLASLAYGSYSYANYPDTTDKNQAVSIIKPGDIVCYNYSVDKTPKDGHWIFVTGVSGSVITFGECNYGCTCQIRWGRTLNIYSLDAIKVYSAPNALTISHDHSYTSTITTQPTCTENGVRTYTCSCGNSYTETISKLGHDYVPVVTKPTCVTGGYTTYTCSRCKDTYVSDETDQNGHSWSTIEETPATCTKAGKIAYKCQICEEEKEEIIPALGHDYIAKELVKGCNTDTKIIHQCSRCDDKYEETKHNDSDYSDWTDVKFDGVSDDSVKTKIQYRAKVQNEFWSDETEVTDYETDVGDFEWSVNKTGTVDYVDSWPINDRGEIAFPADNSLYKQYNVSVKDFENNNNSVKRVYNKLGETTAGYIYWHWCSQSNNDGSYNHLINDTSGYDSGSNRNYDTFHAFYSTSYYPNQSDKSNCVYCENSAACTTSGWWNILGKNVVVKRIPYTEYIKMYRHYKWSDFSEWQDEEIVADAKTMVETRTLYSYDLSASATHSYSEKWSNDEAQHWHECSACSNKTDIADHVYDNDDDTTCNVCGYVRTIEKPEEPVDENSAKIVVESKRALCGQDFTVDVTVKNNPGFAYLELTPVYSDKLTLVSVTNGELIGDLTKGKQYVWVADEDVLTDGKLMTFNFTTSSDVEPGEYEVGFIVRSCVNGNEKIIDIAVENATIEIVDFTYGDANGDGVINGQDVVRIKKYLANYDYDTETSTTEISAGADANGDGVINGQDVVRLKKYLANYDYETETSTIVLGPQN